MSKISIIGSGSWGTALAQVLADNQQNVILWGRNVDELVDISKYHRNDKYLPGINLNSNIHVTAQLKEALDVDVVVLAIPSSALEDILVQINQLLKHPVLIVNTAKGFHPKTHKRLTEEIKFYLDEKNRLGIVSLIGPSHAEEVAQKQLTLISAVSDDELASKKVQELFSNSYFRVYQSNDVIGSEIAAAAKNIIAIASGILSGLGYGDNAKAALMTRGMAEISRFGMFYGAKAETFLGLTGMGDLIVTCTSHHSRNYQAGYQIGLKNSAQEFLENNHSTVEGIFAAKIVYEEALSNNIDMPITTAVYQVLYESAVPQDILKQLMSRTLKTE